MTVAAQTGEVLYQSTAKKFITTFKNNDQIKTNILQSTVKHLSKNVTTLMLNNFNELQPMSVTFCT